MSDSLEELPLFSLTPSKPEDEGEGVTLVRPESSLSAAVNAWGEALEASGRSINTVKAFTGDMRLVGKYVGAGTAVVSIGTHDLKNFLEWMLNQRGVPCSPKTYARRITSIKAFFRWLVETEVLVENPASPIPQQTVLSPLPLVLTPEEMDAVLHAADAFRKGDRADSRPYTLVGLLLHTGVKKGECLRIHLSHIDLNSVDGPILFIRYGDVSKRYKERKLSLASAWVSAYRDYLASYQPRERLFPWSPRRLEYLLEDIGEAAGLEKHLSFDMCRWTSALKDYQAGMESDKIRQKLGISKIQWREVGNKLDRLAVSEGWATEAE
ncbi:MAG: tyrosine-type recombinase/integrase [Anaerolineaceae bacterium]|nr:MAG: tyrosine-type recombinase/integrase [Anaerolineaceae bacterium]